MKMNKVNAYCVYDRKSKIYNTPYFLINDQVAMRQFQAVVNDKESMLYKYPEDYQMYKIGEFDMLTGKLEGMNPVDICTAISMKKEV